MISMKPLNIVRLENVRGVYLKLLLFNFGVYIVSLVYGIDIHLPKNPIFYLIDH